MSQKLHSFIAGQWRDASGPEYTTEYPHDGSTVAHLNAATATSNNQPRHVNPQRSRRETMPIALNTPAIN